MSAAIFWASIALVAYTYAGYPLLVAALARRRGTMPVTASQAPPLTVVIAACNEETRIAARVLDVLAQDYPPEHLRVIVVDDGSTDDTARAADVGDTRVSVIRLSTNGGKAAALNAAFEHLETDLVAFTDARQRFAPVALRKLVEAFADPDVGAVSGELDIVHDTNADAAAADIGLYWRMEKALRQSEARLGWMHGATGAIYAMRRDLLRPLPPGTILDDMMLPLGAALAGRRLWMAREAIARDTPSSSGTEEFRRKLRTLAGNWQLMAHLPQLLNPRSNPVFFAFISHKLLRLLVPWALLLALVASAAAGGTFYHCIFALQLLAYLVATLALLRPRWTACIPFAGSAGTFVMLNAAALLSLPACILLDPRGLWKKH